MSRFSLTRRTSISGMRSKVWIRRTGICLCLAILLPVVALATQWPADHDWDGITPSTGSSRLDSREFADWTVLWSPSLGSPVLAYGPPVAVADPRDPAGILRQILTAAHSSGQFEPATAVRVGQLNRGHFRELRDGIPVIGGRADYTLNRNGQLMRWDVRSHESWSAPDRHLLDLATAAGALVSQLTPADWQINFSQSHAVWFPDHEHRVLKSAYWIRLEGSRQDQRWEGIVDAVSGEVLLDWPGIQTDTVSGVVHGPNWPKIMQEDAVVAPMIHEFISINGNIVTTDTSGTFSRETVAASELTAELHGPFVEVTNDAGQNGLLTRTEHAPYQPMTWDWTTADATEPELNLFHHVNFIHDWYKVLDPAFDGLDYSVSAEANYGSGYDNAFWNGIGMCFGTGSVYRNFAMFSDVIYHEYTHGVTGAIYPAGTLPYIDQPGAMNEGWSDYISCTINGDPYEAEWIGGYYNSYFRDLTNTLVFPQNWSGEVHGDSRFISAALWQIRGALGAEIADSLAHFARYALAETFVDYLVAVMETDDDDGNLANGTPHQAVIMDAFGRRGIGPGVVPQLAIDSLNYYANGTGGSVGDGDRFIEAGETIELVFGVANHDVLFPPPAPEVQVVVQTDDPEIAVTNGSQSYPSLPAGQRVAITPVLLQVSLTATDRWAHVMISVTCAAGCLVADTFSFSVGTPHLLIVDGDQSTEVDTFVTTALRTQQRIYDRTTVQTGQSLPTSMLPASGVVIWISGNTTGTAISVANRDILQNYLSAGNRVVLTGQQITGGMAGSSFMRNVLHVSIDADTLVNRSVTATSAPLDSTSWYLITGSSGAGNQQAVTSYVLTGSSRAIAHYGRSGTGPIAAVEFAQGKGLLFGFGLEAISGMAGSSPVTELVDRIYAWASDILDAPPANRPTTLPSAYSVGPAYPNPFNGTTSISYSIPSARGGELQIFDLLGRMVDNRPLSAGAGVVSWSPHVASGVYFAQVKWNGGASQPLKLLYLR